MKPIRENQKIAWKIFSVGAIISSLVFAEDHVAMLTRDQVEFRDEKAYEKESGQLFSGVFRGSPGVDEDDVYIPYKNGVRQGKYSYRYSSGGPKIEGWFVDGEEWGAELTYYPSGALESKSYYVEGKQNGPSMSWFESGMLEYVGSFIDDRREGAHVWFFETGKKSRVAYFLNDNLHGPYTEWGEDGSTSKIEHYLRGELVSEEKWRTYTRTKSDR